MSTVIRHVAVIHHIIFMSVDILISAATDAVYLLDDGSSTLFITLLVPGKLMHTIIYDAIRD